MKKIRTWISLLVVVGLGAGWWLSWNQNYSAQDADAPINPPGPSHNDGSTAPASPPGTADPSSSPFAIRGVIEGFYGPPWTLSQRVSMFSFMAENHFNTYVYAPKDDPYQRSRWGDLYPPGQLEPMKTLVQEAAQNQIRFVYSLSPGIPAPLPGQKMTPEMETGSITFSSPTHRRRLAAKIDQLRSLGVHTFMLSFDDVQRRLKKTDQKAYGTNYARAHIDLANDLWREEKAKDPEFELWFVPTTYYGLRDNSYWATLRSGLYSSIQVIWTGAWVLNQEITSDQAQEVARWLGRKPLIWDNYPVNDYTYVVKKAPQLLMGPLEHRSPDLSDHVSGYLANPLLQPEASKVALATIGQYLYDPHAYEPESAWKAAISRMPGVSNPTLFEQFCAYSRESTLRPKGNPDFAKLATAFWKGQDQKGTNPGAKELRREFTALSHLPPQLHSSISNQGLLTEIDPWVTKLGDQGKVGLLALQYLELPSSDPLRAKVRQQLKARLENLKRNPLRVGNEMVEFIDQSLAH